MQKRLSLKIVKKLDALAFVFQANFIHIGGFKLLANNFGAIIKQRAHFLVQMEIGSPGFFLDGS